MSKKAIIFGIKGHKLSANEIKLFKFIKPWGIILFSRNIKNIIQLKDLISSIKKIVNDKKLPILIDQEGGKVSRLNKIIDFSIFSQYTFGKLFKKNEKNFLFYYKIYVNSVSSILNEVGINLNTVPVLDVKRNDSHNIIGDRSFSRNPKNVAKLGKLCVTLYKKNKIGTIIKHIPGHGLSKVDSHYETPVVKKSKKELIKKDFLPFKLLKNSFFAMTAHIVYEAFDKKNTATHSKVVIRDVIRNRRCINFKGILISDDISMKSLDKDIESNALKALKAGCNLVLHCNGNIKEMFKLAKVIPNVDKFTKKKHHIFIKF